MPTLGKFDFWVLISKKIIIMINGKVQINFGGLGKNLQELITPLYLDPLVGVFRSFVKPKYLKVRTFLMTLTFIQKELSFSIICVLSSYT